MVVGFIIRVLEKGPLSMGICVVVVVVHGTSIKLFFMWNKKGAMRNYVFFILISWIYSTCSEQVEFIQLVLKTSWENSTCSKNKLN